MSKHTPGSWETDFFSVQSSDGRAICRISQEHRRYGDPARTQVEAEDEANARLIAAAPDLLEACQAAAMHCQEILNDPTMRNVHPIGLCPVLDQLNAAIAKAEGAS